MFLTTGINDKKVNVALSLDQKEAFDTVDHEILISKLESYGMHGDAKKWSGSYLSDRYQYCSLNGCRSTAKRVTCGIPQGSCPGPFYSLLLRSACASSHLYGSQLRFVWLDYMQMRINHQ